MSPHNVNLDAKLLAAQIAIDNSLSDEEIGGYLNNFGYDQARITVGKVLYEQTRSLQQKQNVDYASQKTVTGDLKVKQTATHKEYMKFVKVSRVCLKDDVAATQKLALNGRRITNTFAGWYSQVNQFYLNAISDDEVIAKLTGFGVLKEHLEAGKAMLDEVSQVNASQENEKGEAQQATHERNKTAALLSDWMSDFTAIARVALVEKPQLLEKLGIKEPS